MTRLQEKLTADQQRQLRSITSQRRNADHIVVIPPDLMVPETDFEQLANELNPQHHDVRRRPGSISNPR